MSDGSTRNSDEPVFVNEQARLRSIEEENVRLRDFVRLLRSDIIAKAREIRRLDAANRSYLKVIVCFFIRSCILSDECLKRLRQSSNSTKKLLRYIVNTLSWKGMKLS